MTRAAFQDAMRVHQHLLLEDIRESMRDPGLSWFDEVLNRRAARHLARLHGEEVVREVLAALSEIPDFPPAIQLWNAEHRLVPLYCFLRAKREPVFRVINLEVFPQAVEMVVEYGRSKKAECIREEITLRRNRQRRLILAGRLRSQ